MLHDTDKTYIQFLKKALVYGLIDKMIVVRWADHIVLEKRQNDYFFIDLCMSGSRNDIEIIRLIDGYLPNPHLEISGRPILGLLYSKLNEAHSTWSTENIINVLQEVFEDDEFIFNDGEIEAAQNILKSASIVGQGYSESELNTLTFGFLSIYDKFAAGKPELWPEYNPEIDSALAAYKSIQTAINSYVSERRQKVFQRDLETYNKNETKTQRHFKFTVFHLLFFLISAGVGALIHKNNEASLPPDIVKTINTELSLNLREKPLGTSGLILGIPMEDSLYNLSTLVSNSFIIKSADSPDVIYPSMSINIGRDINPDNNVLKLRLLNSQESILLNKKNTWHIYKREQHFFAEIVFPFAGGLQIHSSVYSDNLAGINKFIQVMETLRNSALY